MPVWLLIFVLTPIVEMYLLIEVGGYLGVWPTIGLVMLTAVIGIGLLKRQGLATLTRGLNRMESGQLPLQEVAEGLLLAVAGALLLTPGFVTDAVGFALLAPAARRAIARRLVAGAGVGGGSPPPGSPAANRPGGMDPKPSGRVIEGEFERRP